MNKALHYSGEIKHANGHVLPGWAACCSGDRADKIRADGSHTRHRGQVTCKACLKMIAKHDAWASRNACPTCSGKGMTVSNFTADECHDCNGTGK